MIVNLMFTHRWRMKILYRADSTRIPHNLILNEPSIIFTTFYIVYSLLRTELLSCLFLRVNFPRQSAPSFNFENHYPNKSVTKILLSYVTYNSFYINHNRRMRLAS